MLVGHGAAEVAVRVDGAGGANVYLNVPFLFQAHGPYGEGFRQLDQFGVHFCLHFKFSDSIDCFILSLISSGETS